MGVFAHFEWTSDATYAIQFVWLPRPLLSMYLLWRDITMGLGMDRFDCCHHSNVQSGCNRVTGLCFVLVCRPVLYPHKIPPSCCRCCGAGGECGLGFGRLNGRGRVYDGTEESCLDDCCCVYCCSCCVVLQMHRHTHSPREYPYHLVSVTGTYYDYYYYHWCEIWWVPFLSLSLSLSLIFFCVFVSVCFLFCCLHIFRSSSRRSGNCLVEEYAARRFQNSWPCLVKSTPLVTPKTIIDNGPER